MNYGEIEKQTFRTFLVFTTFLVSLILVFFNIASKVYRVTNLIYDDNLNVNISSLDKLSGTSIWLVDNTNFEGFYEDNPSVERISIKRELPDTLLIQIDISEKLAYIEDKRQSPPRTFVLYKNLYTHDSQIKEGLLTIKINNGPVKEGFLEEVVSLVMTLKKYSLNLSNIEGIYDGESLRINHFDTSFYLGSPSDLGRKASVLGYYISEQSCVGEIRLVYSEDEKDIRAVTNCK
tara:strand:- start:1088 stop:1789 length:702 start_codon:yes stop_codon:yes gene_type:complete